MIGALRPLLNLRSDRESIDAVSAAWPEFLVKRRWNGWAAWLRDDTTGQPAAVAKTPWRLAAEIRKVYIGPRR